MSVPTFKEYQEVAKVLTERNELEKYWDVDSFVLTHFYPDNDNDLWDIYSPDIYIDGVHMRLGFCENGIEIFSLFCGVTDDTFDDTVNLIEASMSSVYNFTYSNLHDTLTDNITYPLREITKEHSYYSDFNYIDSFAEMVDDGTTVTYHQKLMTIETKAANDVTVMEIRTRVYEGEEVRDIIVLHLQNE